MNREELRTLGINVDAAACARLERFVALLLEKNRQLNLTGAKDAAELWRRHVADSLMLARQLAPPNPLSPVLPSPQTLLDLGSGGGLPGIPLACVLPNTTVTLLDATAKKIAALDWIIAGLGIHNVRTIRGRAETLARLPQCRETFDVLTARAVAALPTLLEYAAGFLRPGGACWFFKSASSAPTEQAAAEPIARRRGLSPGEVHAYRLPGDDADRVLLEYRKPT